MSSTPIEFLIADVDLGPVIEDISSEITPGGLNLLRVTDTYHRVIGYLAESKIAGIEMLGTNAARMSANSKSPTYDPLNLGPDDINILADIIRRYEESQAKADASVA